MSRHNHRKPMLILNYTLHVAVGLIVRKEFEGQGVCVGYNNMTKMKSLLYY